MIPFRMRNCLRILRRIYLDIRPFGITFLWVKFILFGPREEKIGASNLNLRSEIIEHIKDVDSVGLVDPTYFD
jgi:hypothetical protein